MRKSEVKPLDRGGRFQGDLPDRTFAFASLILELVDAMPSRQIAWTLSKQLARSGTSVGANVHEAEHALTTAEFIQRCSIARKEASETLYWLRLCQRHELLHETDAHAAIQEADELVRILLTIVKNSQASKA